MIVGPNTFLKLDLNCKINERASDESELFYAIGGYRRLRSIEYVGFSFSFWLSFGYKFKILFFNFKY